VFRNEYYDQWYEATQLLNVIPLSEEQQDDGLFSPAEAGAVGLAATYAVAGGLMATKNPYAMATAGVILAIPDPVIVAVSVHLLS
jgi:hypothetical protein